MSELRIRIRIGSEYAGDRETQQFTDSTFAEAVAALQGKHDADSDYHRDQCVFVVNTHAETHTVVGDGKRTRTVTHLQGEPMFGERVTIYGRRISFGEAVQDAQVSWSSGGSVTTENARRQLSIMTLATEIAEAANAEPFCARCLELTAKLKDRFASK